MMITNQQPFLFEMPLIVPEGFTYRKEFLSIEEEHKLLKKLENIEFNPLIMHGQPSKRRIASFGINYSFETGRLTQGESIPEFLKPVIFKVADWTAKMPEDFREVLLTEYQPGSTIRWHRDAPPFGVVVGISLLNECNFKWRRKKDIKWENINLTAAPRSAYIMDGPARSEWEHSIPPTKALRYSITLRTLKAP